MEVTTKAAHTITSVAMGTPKTLPAISDTTETLSIDTAAQNTMHNVSYTANGIKEIGHSKTLVIKKSLRNVKS